jgi:hypothetical protein
MASVAYRSWSCNWGATYRQICMVRDVGDPGGARTRDHMLKRHVLYQLSYRITSVYGGDETSSG